MNSTQLISGVASAAGLLCSVIQAGTVHGYVVDADAHRVRGARVQAWCDVPTDQRPPQRSKLLAETSTDAHGNFALSVDAREVNIIIASFRNQSGAAAPSFNSAVRVRLRHNRPRKVESR